MTIIEIIASNPPAILCALGGIALLANMPGAGILLTLGVALQAGYLYFNR